MYLTTPEWCLRLNFQVNFIFLLSLFLLWNPIRHFFQNKLRQILTRLPNWWWGMCLLKATWSHVPKWERNSWSPRFASLPLFSLLGSNYLQLNPVPVLEAILHPWAHACYIKGSPFSCLDVTAPLNPCLGAAVQLRCKSYKQWERSGAKDLGTPSWSQGSSFHTPDLVCTH